MMVLVVNGKVGPEGWRIRCERGHVGAVAFFEGYMLCGPICRELQFPAPPNCPLRNPKYHLIETIRPSIEVYLGRSRYWSDNRMPGC